MLQALEVQKRVISALIFREMKTRFGDTRLGGLWLVLEPCFHLATLIALWYVVGHLAPMSVNPYLFLLTGIFPYIFFRNSVTRIMKSIDANKALLIFPQIKMFDFILVRLIIESVVFICAFVLILSLLSALGLAEIRVKDPFALIMSLFLMIYSALGLGVFLLAITAVYPPLERFVNIVFRFLYFISGIMYSVDRLPPEFMAYIEYNPLFHIINIIRNSFFFELNLDPHYTDHNYVLMVFSLMFVTGMYLIKKYRKYLLQDND